MKKLIVFILLISISRFVAFGLNSNFYTDNPLSKLDEVVMTSKHSKQEIINYFSADCIIEDPYFNSPYDGCDIEIASSPSFLNGIVLGASRVAADFVLPVSSEVSGISFTGEAPSNEDNFSVTYYLNDGNLPGDIYAGPFFISPVSCPNSIFTNPVFDFKASHPPISFNGGQTYWVSIFNSLTPNMELRSQSWGWFGTSEDPSTIAGFARNTNGSNDYEMYPPNFCFTNVAFSLGQASPVPTLSQWGLITMSMIMLIFGLLFLRSRKVICG